MTTTMKKRTRAEAKRLMWEYYKENKRYLPHWIRFHREEVLDEIVNGAEPISVFARFVICEATHTNA